MITPRDEDIDKALFRVYIFLLKLARDRQNVTTASVINSDERLEPLQQNTHPKYNAPHDTVANGPRGSRVKRLSPRLRKAACPKQKGKRQKV